MTLRRLGWGFILSILILTSVSIGFAQEALTQQVDLDNGFTISFPDDWFAERSEDIAAHYFTSSQGDISGFILDPASLRLEVPTVIQSDLENALIETYNTLISSSRVRSRDIEFFELGNFPAASYRFEEVFDGTTYEDILYIIQFDEGEFGALVFSTLPGGLDDNEALISSIAATFAPAGQSSTSASNGNSTGNSSGISSAFGNAFGGNSGNNNTSQTNTTVSADPCLISTNQADTVQLRVGPGFNRAVVLFLPPGEEFTVIGTNTTDDGDEWFQLIKDEVAPQSGASELWVLRDNVSESGDCDVVGDASAPPVVPIVNTQPQATAAPGQTTTTNAGLIIPTGGTWTLTYNAQGDASCEGSGNFQFGIGETSLSPVLVGNLVVSNGGNTFSYYGVVYNRVTGSNNFRGLASFDDGTSNESFATFTSSTAFVGSDIFNESFDGTPCSATIGFSARLG